MSFSSDVKAELCRVGLNSRAQALAECYGVMLFCNTFDNREIRVVTRSDCFAQRLPKLLQRAFSLKFDEQPEGGGQGTFVVSSTESVARILDAFGYLGGLVSHHVNLGLLEDESSRAGFLRGAFLAGGSVTDPEKRYHLELVTDHYMVSREITALFLDMGFEPKSVSRGGNYIMYFKQSSVIEDLLTTIGAPLAAMRVMAAKIEKDMTNQVNRKVNCDTANVTKTVEASAATMEAIRKLRSSGTLENLSPKLREAAILREENPELSIEELGALCDPPVTKSGINHRLRQLRRTADEIK